MFMSMSLYSFQVIKVMQAGNWIWRLADQATPDDGRQLPLNNEILFDDDGRTTIALIRAENPTKAWQRLMALSAFGDFLENLTERELELVQNWV